MIRVVFWDIDGTLMTSNGAASAAFGRTIKELHGRSCKPKYLAGLTDPVIIRNALAEIGIGQQVDADYMKRFMDVYPHILNEELYAKGPYAFPGVRECVEELSGKAVQGLITGNMKIGAEIKLMHVGLHGYFQVGAYADDSTDRNEIARIAADRARQMLEGRISEMVVLGDTEYDANCARAIGAKMIGVTQHKSSFGLTKENTHYIFQDLTDTKKVLEAILK